MGGLLVIWELRDYREAKCQSPTSQMRPETAVMFETRNAEAAEGLWRVCMWKVKLGPFRALKSLRGKGETAREKLSKQTP